jgi:NodT family efflux transporter outer membrane factor (OMF) lipoprotein
LTASHRPYRLATALLAVLCFASLNCASKEYADKRKDVVELQDNYGDYEVDGIGTERWCSDFGSDGLNRVVQKTWEQNLELKAAWARLEQAKAQVAQVRSNLWPEVGTEAGATFSNQADRLSDSLQGGDGGGTGIGTRWEASLTASYEVDIWGKYRHRAKAAKLDARAQRSAARAMAMTLTSEVAGAWFDIIAARQRLDLIDGQIEYAEEFLSLTRLRFSQGLANELDITQQRQNLEALRGERVDAKVRLEMSRHRLAVLTGTQPNQLREIQPEDLPELPPIPDPGVPADLLKQRPDVKASLLRLRAADQRTAAALADRLPTLNLSAGLLTQASNLDRLLDELVWSVSAIAAQSIYEGGRLKAAQREAESIAQERLYQYGQTLLEALKDVQDALVGEKNQQERLQSLRDEYKTAKASLEAARAQYREGNLDYFRVLDALQTLQQLEREKLNTHREQLAYRVSLCRAIGGNWTKDIESSLDSGDKKQSE